MIGGNVTEDWRKASNKAIADNLINSIGELLDGEIHYSTLLDHKGVLKRKVSIIYEEEN